MFKRSKRDNNDDKDDISKMFSNMKVELNDPNAKVHLINDYTIDIRINTTHSEICISLGRYDDFTLRQLKDFIDKKIERIESVYKNGMGVDIIRYKI